MGGCRALTDDEVVEFKKHFTNQRDKCFFVLGYRTGLRVSELLSIREKDVFRFGRVVDSVYIKAVHLKGKQRSATIPLHSEAKAEIELLLSEYETRDPERYLFQSRVGVNRPINRKHAWRILKGIANSMELQGRIGNHSLKKTYGWKFYRKSGHDMRSTQLALRHSHINTSIIYLEPDQKEVDRLILEL